jgi:hypothetical protein
MGGGGESKSEAYEKFGAGKYDSSDFERYVDSRGDLAAAWKKIVSNPDEWDSKYWIDRGATSKAAFGRAHAAEDAKLYAGTYGAGGTKVVPGSTEYDDYFGGNNGTYWDNYNRGKGGEGGGSDGTSEGKPPWDNPTNKANPYFPMLVPEYNDPKAQDWSQYMSQGGSGLLFQPWSQEYGEQYMQPNIWNYQPPELKVGRPKYFQNPLGIMDVTEYVPPSEAPTTTPPDGSQTDGTGGSTGGDGDNIDNMGNTLGLFPGDQGYLLGLAIAAAKAAAAEAADRLGGDKHDDGNDTGDSGGHHGGAEGGAGGGHSNK